MTTVLRAGLGIATVGLVLAAALSAPPDPPLSPDPPAPTLAAHPTAAPEPITPITAVSPAPREETVAECPGAAGDTVLHVFPFFPRAGGPLRVVAVGPRPRGEALLEIRGETASSARLVPADDTWGPGPHAWEFVLPDGLPAGRHRLALHLGDASAPAACSRLAVAAPLDPRRPLRPVPDHSAAWSVRRPWTRELEDLYSVWVGRLFRPYDGFRAWRRLQVVLRAPDRNLLFNALGWEEDGASDPEASSVRPAPIRARTDCADLPYALRAYFSWKFGLPFKAERCNRRTALSGPECYEVRTNLTERYADLADPVERFNRYLESEVAYVVHSATPRTLPEDQDSDFYPVPLTRDALRPGTVYVWPHGHLVVLTDWVRQADGSESLLAVDGHMDGRVRLQRFTPETFPYLPGLRTPGFKAFRPVVLREGEVIPVDNAGLAGSAAPLPFSLEQYRFRHSGEFYDRVRSLGGSGEAIDPTRIAAAAVADRI